MQTCPLDFGMFYNPSLVTDKNERFPGAGQAYQTHDRHIIADWNAGDNVDSSFDCPGDATKARAALKFAGIGKPDKTDDD